jgi:hypothetical protein
MVRWKHAANACAVGDHANNHPANMRHIAPTLDKDNVYDGITQSVWLALAEDINQEIDSSPLSKAGAKLPLPNQYSGSSKLEDFDVFVSNLLHWLKINCS